MELNHTCLELLKILYDQQDYVTIGDLAEQLGKTERSVRYNLDTIDAFMKKKKLPFLHRKFGSGIYMEHTAEIESILQNLLSSVTPYQYKFSTAEREIYLELCLMIGLLLCKQAAKIFQTICKKETALKRVLRNLLSAISFAQI